MNYKLNKFSQVPFRIPKVGEPFLSCPNGDIVFMRIDENNGALKMVSCGSQDFFAVNLTTGTVHIFHVNSELRILEPDCSFKPAS